MACIYRHIRLDTNEPFYIGMGKSVKRAFSIKDRNTHWNNIYNSQKKIYKVEIILDDLTWEDAQNKEIEFIKLYGRRDLGKGSLCNFTDGGQGNKGYKAS